MWFIADGTAVWARRHVLVTFDLTIQLLAQFPVPGPVSVEEIVSVAGKPWITGALVGKIASSAWTKGKDLTGATRPLYVTAAADGTIWGACSDTTGSLQSIQRPAIRRSTSSRPVWQPGTFGHRVRRGRQHPDGWPAPARGGSSYPSRSNHDRVPSARDGQRVVFAGDRCDRNPHHHGDRNRWAIRQPIHDRHRCRHCVPVYANRRHDAADFRCASASSRRRTASATPAPRYGPPASRARGVLPRPAPRARRACVARDAAP
jgi:hypothetical protein